MPIKEYAVFDDFIEYSGPFEVKELWVLIDTFFKNHHYDPNEKRHYERREEEGRLIEVDLEPQKYVSDFLKFHVNMEIRIHNIKNLEVEVQGKKKTIQQADVRIKFRAFVSKVYGERWERNPFGFFIRWFTDKFFYRLHISRFTDELSNDVNLLKTQLKAFLNLYQRR